jgi:hypothetical protein
MSTVGTIGDDGALAFSETHGVLVNRLIGLANLILVIDNRERFRLISLDNFPRSRSRRHSDNALKQFRTRRGAPNLFVIARLFSELNKMRSITFFMLTLLALIAASSTARAQTKLGPKDGEGLPAADLNRIKPGDAAPDFTLEDQEGKPVTLSDYRGKKTIVLVFYRGYW